MSSNDLGLLEVCSPEKATIHIVLIHGLNGGRSKTWTNKQNQFWPTWIGQQIPGARVWVYGYNANVWFSGSHDHIVLHAKKLLSVLAEAKVGLIDKTLIPTVLVGHSLGGILIKQAMVLASFQKTLIYSYLFDAVVSVAFCGTPHRGSIWANRLFALSLKQAPLFVNLLRRGTPHSLSDIADKFNNVWGQKPVLTFIEQKGVPVLGIIVRQSDAVTNCSRERTLFVQKDHREMVKPDSPMDLFFTNLKTELENLQKIIPHTDNYPRTLSGPTSTSIRTTADGMRHGTRKRLYLEFCHGHNCAWENRLYPSGDLEIGPDDRSSGITRDNFEGGVFYYNWPPGSTTCVTMIVDLTTFTFEWSITSPDSLYYPGRHAGTIIVSAQYPFQDRGMVVRPTWITPRLCPFVSSSGSLCPASGNWGDIWTPAMKLDELTSTLASVIHYGPLLERMPPSIQQRYIALHPFDERSWIYMTKEAWFQNATNFFCRAYNMDNSALEDGSDSDEMSSEVSSQDSEFTNSEATDDMCRSSINAIGELLLYTRGSRDVPPELNPGGLRAHISLEECFSSQRLKTRKDWMIEERIWANALAQDYRVKTLGYSSRY